MFDEIGSNFCEMIPRASTYLSDKNGLSFFDSGRSAIRMALMSAIVKDKSALLPQYTCETVIAPFEEAGYDIAFYPIKKDFEIDKASFETLVKAKKTAVILIHQYFGFATVSDDMRVLISQLRSTGTIIIEDLTQSVFSDCRIDSDAYVGSLRKWCSVPDGGFAYISVKDRFSDLSAPKQENADYVLIRLEGQENKRKYICNQIPEIKVCYRKEFTSSEQMLCERNDIFTMSNYTRERIMAVDYGSIVSKRKKNYLFLQQALSDCTCIHIPRSLNDEVPLYFPIFVKCSREKLQMYLASFNIYAPVIWPVPERIENELSADTRYVYDHILAIPCDQRYTVDDMKRISDTIHRYYEETA